MSSLIKLGQLQGDITHVANIELLNRALQFIENWINSATGKQPDPTQPPVATGDHHKLINLTTFDDHPQYAYLAGRFNIQTLIGGTTSLGQLRLQATAADANCFLNMAAGAFTLSTIPGGITSLVYSSSQSLFYSLIAASGTPRISTVHKGDLTAIGIDNSVPALTIQQAAAGGLYEALAILDSNGVGVLQAGRDVSGRPYLIVGTPGGSNSYFYFKGTASNPLIDTFNAGQIQFGSQVGIIANGYCSAQFLINTAKTGSTSTVLSIIYGNNGQTADMLQFQNFAGATLSGVTAKGNFYTNAPVDLVNQSADIGSTTIDNRVGWYRVSGYLADTASDITAGAVTLTIGWTDDVGATTSTINQVLTGTGRTPIDIVLYLASGNLTYATTHTGIFGSAKYALRLRTEFLG